MALKMLISCVKNSSFIFLSQRLRGYRLIDGTLEPFSVEAVEDSLSSYVEEIRWILGRVYGSGFMLIVAASHKLFIFILDEALHLLRIHTAHKPDSEPFTELINMATPSSSGAAAAGPVYICDGDSLFVLDDDKDELFRISRVYISFPSSGIKNIGALRSDAHWFREAWVAKDGARVLLVAVSHLSGIPSLWSVSVGTSGEMSFEWELVTFSSDCVVCYDTELDIAVVAGLRSFHIVTRSGKYYEAAHCTCPASSLCGKNAAQQPQLCRAQYHSTQHSDDGRVTGMTFGSSRLLLVAYADGRLQSFSLSHSASPADGAVVLISGEYVTLRTLVRDIATNRLSLLPYAEQLLELTSPSGNCFIAHHKDFGIQLFSAMSSPPASSRPPTELTPSDESSISTPCFFNASTDELYGGVHVLSLNDVDILQCTSHQGDALYSTVRGQQIIATVEVKVDLSAAQAESLQLFASRLSARETCVVLASSSQKSSPLYVISSAVAADPARLHCVDLEGTTLAWAVLDGAVALQVTPRCVRSYVAPAFSVKDTLLTNQMFSGSPSLITLAATIPSYGVVICSSASLVYVRPGVDLKLTHSPAVTCPGEIFSLSACCSGSGEELFVVVEDWAAATAMYSLNLHSGVWSLLYTFPTSLSVSSSRSRCLLLLEEGGSASRRWAYVRPKISSLAIYYIERTARPDDPGLSSGETVYSQHREVVVPISGTGQSDAPISEAGFVDAVDVCPGPSQRQVILKTRDKHYLLEFAGQSDTAQQQSDGVRCRLSPLFQSEVGCSFDTIVAGSVDAVVGMSKGSSRMFTGRIEPIEQRTVLNRLWLRGRRLLNMASFEVDRHMLVAVSCEDIASEVSTIMILDSATMSCLWSMNVPPQFKAVLVHQGLRPPQDANTALRTGAYFSLFCNNKSKAESLVAVYAVLWKAEGITPQPVGGLTFSACILEVKPVSPESMSVLLSDRTCLLGWRSKLDPSMRRILTLAEL